MGWSEELRNKTYSALDNGEFDVFMNGGVCYLKHSDGSFGTISMKNAFARNWLVESKKGESFQFETIDALIDDGWALD